MTTPQEIKEKVSWLRRVTDGVPIGAKMGCGNVEKDIRVLVDAGVDFITLDGFGGGTGATLLTADDILYEKAYKEILTLHLKDYLK